MLSAKRIYSPSQLSLLRAVKEFLLHDVRVTSVRIVPHRRSTVVVLRCQPLVFTTRTHTLLSESRPELRQKKASQRTQNQRYRSDDGISATVPSTAHARKKKPDVFLEKKTPNKACRVVVEKPKVCMFGCPVGRTRGCTLLLHCLRRKDKKAGDKEANNDSIPTAAEKAAVKSTPARPSGRAVRVLRTLLLRRERQALASNYKRQRKRCVRKAVGVKGPEPESGAGVMSRRKSCTEHVGNSSDMEGDGCEDNATDRPETKHRYDVFVSHGESDVELAQEIVKQLETHELSCLLGDRDFLPGTFKSEVIADAVQSSRRVVLLLSRKYLQTGWSTFELLVSVCEMYDSQRVLIVPVLVDITEAEVPPCLRNVSLVDMRRDPNYQHKLMTILKAPEVTVRELMPAGNVSHGLAWCYYLNYLRFILPDMARRVDKWCDPESQNSKCMDVRMPRKLYILVPESCFCPRILESSGPEGSVVFGGHLEDLVRTTAGSVDRVYKHTVWNIQRQNGEVLQFVGEYSNIVHTLYLMECERSAGLDTQQLQVQKDQFLGILQNLLKCYGHESQAKVVFFRDKDGGKVTPLSTVLAPLVQQDRLPPTSPTPMWNSGVAGPSSLHASSTHTHPVVKAIATPTVCTPTPSHSHSDTDRVHLTPLAQPQ